jgi:hypothetical protein
VDSLFGCRRRALRFSCCNPDVFAPKGIFWLVSRRAGQSKSLRWKTAVKFNISEADAVDRLKDLIREHGKWIATAKTEAVLA